jgi:hypothetical protein
VPSLVDFIDKKGWKILSFFEEEMPEPLSLIHLSFWLTSILVAKSLIGGN